MTLQLESILGGLGGSGSGFFPETPGGGSGGGGKQASCTDNSHGKLGLGGERRAYSDAACGRPE